VALDDIQDPDIEDFHSLRAELLALFGQNPPLRQGMPEFSADALQAAGRYARVHGVVPRVRNVIWNAVDDGSQQLVSLLPKLRSSWDDFDYTRSPKILERRYDRITDNSRNSCATDALLFASIYSGAVIRQVDAISFRAFCNELTLIQRKVRLLLARPWGLLSQDARNQARDELMQAMVPRPSLEDMVVNLHDLVNAWFEGMPSFSYTVLDAIVCCDIRKPRVISGCTLSPLRRTVLTFQLHRRVYSLNTTLAKIINSSFAPEPAKDQDRKFACNGPACQQAPRRLQVVLDRLPPALIVNLERGPQISHNKARGFFADICVKHTTTSQHPITKVSYFVEGVIFRAGKHFVGRWKGKGTSLGRLAHFDGVSGAEVSTVDNWIDGLSLYDQVSVLFYRRSISQPTA